MKSLWHSPCDTFSLSDLILKHTSLCHQGSVYVITNSFPAKSDKTSHLRSERLLIDYIRIMNLPKGKKQRRASMDIAEDSMLAGRNIGMFHLTDF